MEDSDEDEIAKVLKETQLGEIESTKAAEDRGVDHTAPPNEVPASPNPVSSNFRSKQEVQDRGGLASASMPFGRLEPLSPEQMASPIAM